MLPVVFFAGSTWACSICSGYQQSLSVREQASKSNTKAIFFGIITNSTLNADGSGKTTISLTKTLKIASEFKAPPFLTIPQYLPCEASSFNGILLFTDFSKGGIDVVRGVPIPSKEVQEYVEGAMLASSKEGPALLDYFLPNLQSSSREIAADAFLEFAKASDATLLNISKKMNPALLKSWILDPKVPEDRLGLFAFLLGGCGAEADVNFLFQLLKSPSSRAQASYDGALVALIRLYPNKGWSALNDALRNDDTSLQLRLACIRSIKASAEIYQNESDRTKILNALNIALKQGELADLAIEELRRMKRWELTPEIISLYGTKGYNAPVMKRAFLRYALTAPNDQTIEFFLNKCREKEPQVLLEVQESLGFTQLKP